MLTVHDKRGSNVSRGSVARYGIGSNGRPSNNNERSSHLDFSQR